MITVKFINVGRNNATWEQDIKQLDHHNMYKAVMARGVLMSRGVDFGLNDDDTSGVIYAGERPVGTFKIIQ